MKNEIVVVGRLSARGGSQARFANDGSNGDGM